jgi:hypothetical protein
MSILEKYFRTSYELAIQGKTGQECAYCGNPNTQEYRGDLFCAGCGIERRKELARYYGLPIYDPDDAAELLREFNPILLHLQQGKE